MKKVLIAILNAVVKSNEINIKHNASSDAVWMREITKW